MFKPIENNEQYEKYLREVVGPIYDSVMDGTEKLYSSEDVDEMLQQWASEDGLAEDEEHFKRSA